MKVLLIGSNGTIGKAVSALLTQSGYTVIGANRSSGDFRVDLTDKASIAHLFDKVGKINAIVSTASEAKSGKLDALTDEDFQQSLDGKLMGQVNLVRLGHRHLSDKGSITLTGGVLAQSPMSGGSIMGLVNAALSGFVLNASMDLPKGTRLNVVSPIFVANSAIAATMGAVYTMLAAPTAKAYLASIQGSMNGQTLDVRLYV